METYQFESNLGGASSTATGSYLVKNSGSNLDTQQPTTYSAGIGGAQKKNVWKSKPMMAKRRAKAASSFFAVAATATGTSRELRTAAGGSQGGRR